MRKEEKRRKRNQKQGLIYTLVLVILAAVIGLGTYLFMTSGRKEYQVPNLENLTLEEAEQVLKEANLVLSGEIEYEESDEIDEDHIIRQTPGVNQFVKKNRKIKVVVSIGGENGKIEVPDVTDIPLEKAQRMLEKAELQYTVEEKYDEDTKIGYVISQSPKEGVMVKEGYSVKLYVCGEDEENEQVVVPKLTGYTEAQAKALLEEAGLVPGTVDKEPSSAPAGTVISQNPAAKTGVVKASKVNFTLSSGEEEKPVLKKKTLTITIPDDANDTVHIKVVANDKVIHDKDHQKSEGTVDIVVQASKDANVKAYIDNVLVVDKVITFE